MNNLNICYKKDKIVNKVLQMNDKVGKGKKTAETRVFSVYIV